MPSFFVNIQKNVWNDFGHGGGGNVLDFIMTYWDISDVSTALRQLEEIIGGFGRQIRSHSPTPPSVRGSKPATDQTNRRIEKIQLLQNKALIQLPHTTGKNPGYCPQLLKLEGKGSRENSEYERWQGLRLLLQAPSE
ncbi:hypothetical protein H8E77_33915 [bacterium]|nr:hypothetical protein [bacterium]